MGLNDKAGFAVASAAFGDGRPGLCPGVSVPICPVFCADIRPRTL